MIKADYIILGAGASGLMLAYRMARDSFFDASSIIIIDKAKDKSNDRTWCYWEEGQGEWDDIVFKSWQSIFFGSEKFSMKIPLNSYSYKMIKSEFFYKKIWKELNKKSNISFYEGNVQNINDVDDEVIIKTDGSSFKGKKVFSSLLLSDLMTQQTKYPVLQQHFIGWFIKTDTPQFNEGIATFMDFEIPQKGNTRFMYVLPTSDKEALLEYTLFSKDLLPEEEYEDAIKAYLTEKRITEYSIEEKERGSIPMTSFKFSKSNGRNLMHIGTAGGWTKASTGYTFRNTTKKTEELVQFLKSNSDLTEFNQNSRFAFYDMLMLDVLAHNNAVGSTLFSSLFKNSSVKTIFRFLDEESNFLEELKIMASVPSWDFIKALVKRTF